MPENNAQVMLNHVTLVLKYWVYWFGFLKCTKKQG